MSDLDYGELQRTAARTATDRFVLPMLQKEFPEILERVSMALTGSASFGAADKWSDFDGTVFLLDEDANCWREPLDGALSQLRLGHWADVQDPEVHFNALTYAQWGLRLSLEAPDERPPDQIAPETAWHFQRYVPLFDSGGHLARVQSIAGDYPVELMQRESARCFHSASEALAALKSEGGPLTRWEHTAEALCDLMRGKLLVARTLYPHEKWLWWWFSQQRGSDLPSVRDTIQAAVMQDSGVSLSDLCVGLLQGNGQRHPSADGPIQASEELFAEAFWRDLCWQDNCLYHDIMRDSQVAAFIRVGRCLGRVRQLCNCLQESTTGTCTLDHLEELGHPARAVGHNLKYLPEMRDMSNWRHQVGYVIELLRNALIETNAISVELALKPFG